MNENMLDKNKKDFAKSIFIKPSFYILTFSLLGFAVFVLLKTFVSVFDGTITDQFKSIYYLTNYSRSTVSFVNGIFGTAVTAAMILALLGLFMIIFGASGENTAKILKGMKLIKISVVTAMIISIILLICSIASVSVINHYSLRAAAFGESAVNNSGKMFFTSIVFGALSIISEISLLRLITSVKHYLTGVWRYKDGAGLAEFIAGVGAIVSAVEFVELMYDIAVMNQKNDYLSPSVLVSDILDILIISSLIVFFVSLMMSVYNYTHCIDDDEDFYEDFYEDIEEFEPRVFSKEEKGISPKENKALVLSFDIPHTEYPRK